MRTLKIEVGALKHVISVGREERGLICVGIQDGRSWVSDMFRVEALGKAVEHLEERLANPGKRRVAKPKAGARYE